METKPHLRTKSLACLVAALAVGQMMASAQPAPGNESNRPAPRGMYSDRIAAMIPRGDANVVRVLTEEQRASLRKSMQAHAEQTRALEEKLQVVRRDLALASVSEKFDETAVRKHAKEIGVLETDLAVLRAKVFSEIRPPLSPEQIENIKNPPPMRRLEGGGFSDRLVPANRVPRDEHGLPKPATPPSEPKK